MKLLRAVCVISVVAAAVLGCGRPSKVIDPLGDIPCNGHREFCDRSYDEISYPSTHNSYSYAVGPTTFIMPNQSYPVNRQLADGVRGFMLDVYNYMNDDGSIDVVLYHGIYLMGMEKLETVMTEFKEFLDTHPYEVVTTIFEDYVTEDDLLKVFDKVGVTPYLYDKPMTVPFPTLRAMIASGRRLVAFSEHDTTPKYPWYHYAWGVISDTNYDAHTPAELSCAVNRGKADYPLFLINNMNTDPTLGVGDPKLSHAINHNPFLIDHVLACRSERGRIPNFVAVDFYADSDLFAVVDTLNGMSATP